jgi:hypothetical protein
MGNILPFQKALLLLSFSFSSLLCFAQVKEQWVKRYNGPARGVDAATCMAVDASGNVYAVGQSIGTASSEDYVIIKYDAAGKEVWLRRYNGTGNGYDRPSFAHLDASGNLYVTGGSMGKGGGGDMDYATIKYDAAGTELWVRRYSGKGSNWDEATSLAVDAAGNVFVTGASWDEASSDDCVTIKYDGNGNQLWVKRYNGQGNDADRAICATVDAAGNVYVTGNSLTGATLDYVTIKYDTNGKQVWAKSFSRSQDSFDAGICVTTDSFGNEYVTGYSRNDETDYDCVTIKYDGRGNQLLTRRFNGVDNLMDMPAGMVVDAQGNVYVTGTSRSNASSDDYLTIKYSPNGNEDWVISYNGKGNGTDQAFALFVDASGNVYVTGTSQVGVGALEFDIATIKYDQNGNERWVMHYNGPQKLNDEAKAVAVDAKGNVVVTGTSAVDQNGGSDLVTIQYSQGRAVDVSCGPKGDKVLVCHNGKTLCVTKSAAAGHLKHGDVLGSCPNVTTRKTISAVVDGDQMVEQEVSNFRVSVTPNPFHTTATMQYALPSEGLVSIKIYDMAGQEVATVVKAQKKAGSYATDLRAANLRKGAYYYKALLSVGERTYTQTGKFVVME